ncbi:hypothetical protein PAXRUDRAFT_822460 [Paxillus rubicundulus Ve08.2h10]|uniref:Uncharacterized protein n=1 Tax=Paxillus rubicundulus Ve08.2h10 TaxID=930991 RepID=A0A0D0E550_9AGAM|nr:hypothetical protein PAXRUDRAFT_822460 [Paxillus rubicundulus Ve08.2h10]
MSAEFPTDPKAITKMEKDIAKESKIDDTGYKNALKELSSIEKSEAKASKAATKAEKNLKKMENRDYDTIKTLQKATHSHDQAVTDLHSAQSDLQVKRQQAQRLRQDIDELRKHADQLSKEKQAHDQERSSKLAMLHAQPPPTGQGVGASTTGAMVE